MIKKAVKAEGMLKQLANAKRLAVLCALTDGEHSAGDLTKITGLSHSALSQHLAKMKDAGLLTCEKRGQSVYYRITSPQVKALLSTLYLIYCYNE